MTLLINNVRDLEFCFHLLGINDVLPHAFTIYIQT